MKTRVLEILVFCTALSAVRVHAQETPPEEPAPMADIPESAPPLPPEPPAEVNLQMTPEELAALGLDADKPKLDLSLHLSGFADVGFGFQVGPQDSPHRATGAAPPYSTFFVGNLNVYLGKQLSESFAFLSEVRLSFLPNGASAFGLQERTDTTTYDYNDFGRPTRWGGIIMQRMYIEWMPHQLFSLRVGQFLTPYGVWNVDHGSPVVIPTSRPWSIGVGWIPERQTGIEVLGRMGYGQSTFGYHLTLSNGTGPISEYRDLDENKAFGARLYWEYYGLGRLRLGGSMYYGRDTNAVRRWVTKDGAQASDEEINSQFDSLTWAADLTWEFKGVHLQTEWLTNQRAYTDEGRVPYQTLSGLSIIPVDVFSWGGYSLLGYRLPWFGIMPFFMAERVKGDLLQLKLKLYTLMAGLNIRPTESVAIKANYQYVKFEMAGYTPLHVFSTQIAWAF